jgi:mRNA-degrading endonuclease toxin of MazEF toxin-antitoxin module
LHKAAPAGEIAPTQFALNGADGLEFRSVADCSFYHVVRRDRITGRIGHVSFERIPALKRRIREIFGLL